VLFAILACMVACVAVSSQSLWVDEAQTALKAIPPTLHGWWDALDTEHNSNMQLPLYMLYIWGWARLFGVSEIALRAANIPWFFLGFFAIAHFLRRHPGLRTATLLLFCLHPFVWYYLDEARPYIMQLSGALLVAGALFEALDQPPELSAGWWWLLGAGFTLLCGAGLLGAPWVVAVTILLLTLPAFRRSLGRTGRGALVFFLPVLGLLAAYFAWTARQNIGTGALPMNLASVLSIPYEQLGFLGLGPGRSDLRDNSLRTALPFLPPLLVLGIPLIAALILAARSRFGLSPGRFVSLLVLCAVPTLLVMTVGAFRDARILARHLTPLFPFILLAEAFALLLLWRSGRPLARVAAVLVVAALTASSLEVRFAFRHSKDDYRSASASAIHTLAQGRTLWWAAEEEGGEYYHLPLWHEELPGYGLWGYNVPAHFTAPPDEIYMSKPDLSDPTGGISAFIAANHYQPVPVPWHNFRLWRKPPPPG